MDSVLVGVDRSRRSWRSVKFALERAAMHDWDVTIVHVINWSPYKFSTKEDNERRPIKRQQEISRAESDVIKPLMEWISEENLYPDTTKVTTLIRHGRPSDTIIKLAKSGDYDLIVVGRAGESRMRSALFGSTASRVAENSSVPVVVVP
ncbi:universal stress protein [Halomonas sp. M4R1S46]|uniref:universal stress protein n=1 Tax=Halomonas sp. M4R1S46 TaxID=2982692 RepID=UPI0021E4E344|nr:universal stress protein [Halomonas sp. M4R1S46]UYG08994.1 universal stress protein [Halomonas sp. M4R1S46]